MALSRVVSEIFNVEKCRDLEIGVRGHTRSLKVVPFGRPYMVSYYCSLVSEKNGDFRRKSHENRQFFSPHVYLATPLKWFPLELGIGSGVRRN